VPSGIVISLRNSRLLSHINVAVGDGVSVGGCSVTVGLGRGGAKGVSGAAVSIRIESPEFWSGLVRFFSFSGCSLVLSGVQATNRMPTSTIRKLVDFILLFLIKSGLLFVFFKLKWQV